METNDGKVISQSKADEKKSGNEKLNVKNPEDRKGR